MGASPPLIGAPMRDLDAPTPRRMPAWRPPDSGSPLVILGSAGFPEDVHHVGEQANRLGARTLERVSPHDASECSARRHAANVVEQLVGALGLPTREDDDPLAVEAALDDMLDALGHSLRRNAVLLEDFLRFGLLDDVLRWLDLHDMRAELARDVGGIGDDVGRLLALFREAGAAWIRPNDRREPDLLRLTNE